MDLEAERACHELLLRLAGRLDDRLLWRYRDWLGEGALGTLARTLPKSLLKYRIDLGEPDHQLLVTGLLPHGADRNQVSSLLAVDEPTTSEYTFMQHTPEQTDTVDPVSALLHAMLRGRPEVGEVRESWRQQHNQEDDTPPRRVLLVTATTGQPRLTGELQRVLRVLGELEPSVEVLPDDLQLPQYHAAALTQSRLVCLGAATGQGLVPA